MGIVTVDYFLRGDDFMDGLDGYVSFRQQSSFSILHAIRDPEYMKKEEEAYYAYYEKKKADGVLPPDFTPKPFHIHMEDADKNILLHYEPLKDFYKKTFQPAVDEYDQILLHDGKGHKERVRGDYYSYIYQHDTKKNSTKLAYEAIVQFGGKDDDEKTGVKGISDDPEKREKCLEGLKKYYERWKKENPNLHIVAAAIHMDETSPHLHIIYVPVVLSERGQKVRNDRSTALKSQLKMHGIDISKNGQKENATTAWQERQRVVLREIAKEVGLDMKQTKKPTQRDHEDMREYSARKSAEVLESANKDAEFFLNANVAKLDAQEELIEENDKELLKLEAKQTKYKAFIKENHDYKDYKPVLGKKGYRAVPERDIDMFTAATDDVPKLKQEIESKDTAYTDLYKKYQKANDAVFTAERERDRYKEYKTEKEHMKADIEERLEKAKKDLDISPSELSGILHEYAWTLNNENERKALFKALEALDKLDAYQVKIFSRVPAYDDSFYDDAERLGEALKEQYTKLTTFEGRKEMYSDISALWTDSKAVSTRIYQTYKKHKDPKAAYLQSVHSHYQPLITSLLSSLFELVRLAFELTRQASYGYGR